MSQRHEQYIHAELYSSMVLKLGEYIPKIHEKFIFGGWEGDLDSGNNGPRKQI